MTIYNQCSLTFALSDFQLIHI